MKLGIVIPTYQKIDGTTPNLLKRAIESVKAQTHQDYSLIVIGDSYENEVEFEALLHSLELGEKLTYRNLPEAIERSKYPAGSKELWSAGGVNATNYGITLGLELGLTYICHLDHDDYWHPQHLEVINSTIEQTETAALIATCSTYFNTYLPRVDLTNEIYSLEVKAGRFIHSAICINHALLPLKYRDVYAETGKEYAADADLWDRIGSYIKEHNLNSYQVSSLTCYHPSEATPPATPLVPRGKHTYGPQPTIKGHSDILIGSSIGSFCSIADNLQFIARGAHMVNWVTTYPFQAMWNMEVPLHDLPDHSPIVIGNDVWIAENVKIKQGVTVGDGAVLATECFVTKDVPPYAMVGGNPARIIKYRFTETQIETLLDLKWWNWEDTKIKEIVPYLLSGDVDTFIKIAKNTQ
tara:strand:+ start:1231 stop:2460 length:1230 start_codon:yes stop_codon:yes gene_type:complete